MNIENIIINYKKNMIDGIFFTPIEFHPDAYIINEGIMKCLNKYNIPCILLERDYRLFPFRGKADLVSIDNIAAGYIVTQHFISNGHTKIAFLSKKDSACSVSLRIIGYKQALLDARITYEKNWIIQTQEIDKSILEYIESLGINHVVCGNDFTAMKLISINQKEKIKSKLYTISFDDAEYAIHLSTPLSTYKQPLANIAQTAIETLLQRINNVNQPFKTVYIEGALIIRSSSEQ